MTVHAPTNEQLAALRTFANANGRTWKSKLRHCWEISRYDDYPGTDRYDLLQTVRNTLGPSWLVRFTLPRIEPVAAFDCATMTYENMADIISEIAWEVERRNPIFVNLYLDVIRLAARALTEIHERHVRNPSDDFAGAAEATR